MCVSLMKRIFLVNSPVGLRSLCSFFMSKYVLPESTVKADYLTWVYHPFSLHSARDQKVSVSEFQYAADHHHSKR